jgi:hypothetical protein
MHGQSSTTVKGKLMRERRMQPQNSCRRNCKTLLTGEVCNTIFTEFWKIDNRDTKVSYVTNLIISKSTVFRRKRKIESNRTRDVTYVYCFQFDGERTIVCKDCFKKTLDITNKFIAGCIKNKLSISTGTPVNGKRGKHATANKTSDSKIASFIAHINSFPVYESRFTQKKVICIYHHI